MIATLYLRRFDRAPSTGALPPLVPAFVLGFVVLAGLYSTGLFPAGVTTFAATVSRWALLVAIAAVGLRTNLRNVIEVGGAAIALLIVETLFIATVIMLSIFLLGLG